MAIIRRRVDFANLPPLSAEELEQLARLEAMTPEEIEQNALDDPDNPPFTDEELERLSIAAPIQRARRGMGLTQVQFSERFHINLARLRDWEQGRYKPDSALLAYLKIIAAEPELVSRILEHGASGEKAAAAE
jgi:putative transcriptional regulator